MALCELSQLFPLTALGFLWKEWCQSWNSSTLTTSCEELTHWKRLWCWEGLGAGGEGDDRGWDGWMASPTWWMWVWVNSRRWWWTGRPGVLGFMGSQRVGHDWATELNGTEYFYSRLVMSDSFATPWTVAHQIPLFIGHFRQKHWSGLPLPLPGKSSWPRYWTHIFCVSSIAGRIFTIVPSFQRHVPIAIWRL